MGDRRCCCGCSSWTDSFTLEDSTFIGDDWVEESGDWWIDTTRLQELGNSGAVAVFQKHFSHTSMIVSVVTNAEVDGNVYRLLANFKDDSNYMYAEFCRNAGATPDTLGLYKVVGGVTTELAKEDILGLSSDTRTINICLGSNGFQAYVTNATASLVWSTQVPVHATGYKAGVGNGGSQEILVDDFYISEHLDDNAECPYCICACNTNNWPKTLNLHITFTGRCTAAEQDITLTYDRMTGYWSGTGPVGTCTSAFTFSVICSSVLEDQRLSISPDGNCCSGAALGFSCSGPPEAGSTCDPIYIIRTLTVSGTWLACTGCCPFVIPPITGTIIMEVTE